MGSAQGRQTASRYEDTVRAVHAVHLHTKLHSAVAIAMLPLYQ